MKQALILFFFLLSLSLTAQNVTVNGKLVSAADRDPLPYATISVSREATPANAIKKFATREDGTFATTLSPGKYLFAFHFVGMNGLTKN